LPERFWRLDVNELELLARRFMGLLVRRPGLAVGVWGPPGIGKTHAVARLLRETPCRSLSLHATVRAAELVRALPRPAHLPGWAQPTLERVLFGAHVEPANLMDVLGAVLGGLAPFIVHLEDVHEAAPEQRQFVQTLAGVVPRLKGVGLIVTSRERPPGNIEAIQLEPLSPDEAARMLELEAGSSLPSDALEWIHAHAAGNPLFTLEFFRFLSRQGFVWNDTQRWRWRAPDGEFMPVTVEVLIEQVLHKTVVQPGLKVAAQAKAMLGRSVGAKLWAEVAGLEPNALQEAVRSLELAGVFQDGEFAHPLYTEVLVRNLAADRRQMLARRALEALTDHPDAATAFVEDARLEPDAALAVFERAAQTARTSGHAVQAARFQVKATDYLTGQARGRLALEAARVLQGVNKAEAATALEVAVQELPTDQEAVYTLAKIHATQGNLEQAEAVLNHLSSTLEPQVIWRYRAVLKALGQDFATTARIWRDRPEICDGRDPEVIYQVAFALNAINDTRAAIDLVSPQLEQGNVSALDTCRFLSVLAVAHFYGGEYRQADELFEQALGVAQANNLVEVVAATTMNRSHVLGMLGRIDAQIEALELGLKGFAELGLVKRHTQAQASLANMYVHLGEYERAEAMLLECHQTLSAMGPSDGLCDCEHYLSGLYDEWASPHGRVLSLKYARALLNTARQLNNPRTIGMALLDLAHAETALGHAKQGFELASQVFEMNQKQGHPWGINRAIEEQARAAEALGQLEQAIELFATAEAGMRAIAATEATHRIGLELDRLTGHSDRAAEHLAYFRTHKHAAGAARTLCYFPHLDTPSPPQTASPQTAPPPVHPMRLEVLGAMQFVADGVIVPVRGGKRRKLLAFLLEARIAGRAEVSKLDLLDALYPDASEAQSSSALKEAVHQVREMHGANAIVTTEGGYTLGTVASDAEDFLRTGETRLWRGAYLDGLGIGRANETVIETLHLALCERAKALLETDPAEAARLGRLVCESNPYDLEHLRLTLRALRAAHNHKSLARTYARARERLLEVGEVLPDTWAHFLEDPIGARA
jgi:tetratricopeptide (TPR) repeat protein